MTRGRKKDPTILPTRALTQQRDYRARRAQYVASLEEKCRKVEEENIRLREKLAALSAGRSASPNHEVAEASIQLMHQLSLAVTSLARFQQVAFPEHATNAASSLPPTYSATSYAANASQMSASAFSRPPNASATPVTSIHFEAENKTYNTFQSSAFSDAEDAAQIYSDGGSPECCGGILDCRDLVETDCHEPLIRTSGLRSTSSAGNESLYNVETIR